MNQVKTAVIVGIITIIMLGAVLYALRDNFKGGNSTSEVKE